MWFRTAISPGGSVQIASSLECTRRGFVAIDSFCSLVLILPIMEILLCRVNAHFPGRFAQSFWQTAFNSMCGEIIGTNRAGKCALTSHRGISIVEN